MAETAQDFWAVLAVFDSTAAYVGEDSIAGRHPLNGKAVWAMVFREALIPAYGPGEDARGTAFVLVDAVSGIPREGFFTGTAPAPSDLEAV